MNKLHVSCVWYGILPAGSPESGWYGRLARRLAGETLVPPMLGFLRARRPYHPDGDSCSREFGKSG